MDRHCAGRVGIKIEVYSIHKPNLLKSDEHKRTRKRTGVLWGISYCTVPQILVGHGKDYGELCPQLVPTTRTI